MAKTLSPYAEMLGAPSHHSGDRSQAVFNCPFCGKAGHLYVGVANGLFDCKVCGAAGSLLRFLEKYLPICQASFKGDVAEALSRNRGISDETLQKWGWGFNRRTGEYLCPAFDETVKLRNVYRSHLTAGKLGKAFGLTGLPVYPVGINKITNHDTVWICEGTGDAMALHELGESAVAIPGACTFKAEWVGHFQGKAVIIAYDNDEAGRKGTKKATERLQGIAAGIRVIKWSDKHSAGFDVRDLCNQHGPDAIGILRAMLSEVPDKPSPPVDGGDIRSHLWSLIQNRNMSSEDRHRAVADAVIQWLHSRGTFYYTDRSDFASVMFFDSPRKLLLSIQSDLFLAWLADELAINRASKQFSFIQKGSETEGLTSRSIRIEPARYWAATDGRIFLSCGPGQMVRISAGRVEMVDNGTDGVLFPAESTLPSFRLTTPLNPFQACSLFREMNVVSEHARLLLMLWTIALPTDQRTKPPLCLAGDIGSGKTRLAVGICQLFGLPERTATVTRTGQDDFWATVNAGGMCCFDNVDTRNEWFPDAMAAAATGGTQEKRKLYTDDGRVSLKANAWICLTSTNPTFASDAGLADRLLVVRLNRRTGNTAESALTDEILEHRDAGLSWVAETLSRALAERRPVTKSFNKRHPDFGVQCIRIGRALNIEPDVTEALFRAEADKSIFAVENDWLGSVLVDVLKMGQFHGTASQLQTRLFAADPGLAGVLNVKKLGKRLDKMWQHLSSVFDCRREFDKHLGAMRYTFNPMRRV